MRLFWRYGYEGVSFQQLTTTLGVAAPSLYAAFGNKEALYREALDRYVTHRVAPDLSFVPETLSVADAVRLLLHATARGLVEPGGETGCMLNTGMITSHPDHAGIAKEVADRRTAFRALLTTKLQVWVDPDRAGRLARFLTAVMQGMAIQACDGATTLELLALADQAASGLR
ncbi:TetR/AcrR family transcriptional regulator [Lichenicoccus sp.]|uniref:TetR/AcrR family transcriptional regulator n=1 Tax=Lichenicoccus sp. TaxID=2781899 RepID=UPI003D113702